LGFWVEPPWSSVNKGLVPLNVIEDSFKLHPAVTPGRRFVEKTIFTNSPTVSGEDPKKKARSQDVDNL
jgi:hypothetical protein